MMSAKIAKAEDHADYCTWRDLEARQVKPWITGCLATLVSPSNERK
jgi:hypothetical protein